MVARTRKSTNSSHQEERPLGLAIASFLQEKSFVKSVQTCLFYEDQVGRAFVNGMARQGIASLEAITPEVLRTYLAEESVATYVRGGKTKTLSRGSVGLRQGSAKTFLTWCVDQEWIAKNPMAKVKIRIEADDDGPLSERVGYTGPEVHQILMKSQDNAVGFLGLRDFAICKLLLDTGARAGGIVPSTHHPDRGLTEASFDWPRSRVWVTEKGNKGRWLPVGKAAGAAVKAYTKERPATSATDKLFVTQAGDAFTYAALSKMLQNLGTYCHPQIKPCIAHRFRHTYAAAHYTKHHNIMALMHLLGHTKVDITQKYLRTLGVDYGMDAHLSTPGEWLT